MPGARCLVAGAALTLAACWSPAGSGVSGSVDLAPHQGASVEFTYLGVGGWIIRRGEDQVVAAPLFTNPGLLRTGLLPVRSDTVLVNRYMGRYDVRGASAILVGHGHYDHLMDVPQVARRHAPGAVILANVTTKNLLASWSGIHDRVVVVNEGAGDRDTVGRWIEVGSRGRVRVMALRSHHAPHFEGYTLYHGHTTRPVREEPRWASEWLDGDTFAFLVDFLARDRSVAFRVYVQDAVAAPPRGFAPEVLIAQRPVDVAILVPATFDQVEWHPEAFVQNLKPRWVLLGHWEDFFRSPDEPTRAIFLTDQGHFIDRLRNVHSGGWWLPELWTRFRFPVDSAPRREERRQRRDR